MNKQLKRYIIRKFVLASSVLEAIKKDRKTPADECWIDERWMQEDITRGFEVRKKR